MKKDMCYFLTLLVLSYLFWDGSSTDIVLYYAVHHGQRYGNVSRQFKADDIGQCNMECSKDNPSRPCFAFNFRENDGFCKLIHNERSDLVPSEEYLAFAQWACFLKQRRVDCQPWSLGQSLVLHK
ncbi:unnamed protein product [Darwinula stevensoni]|uniref:Apple domain-containing protein n=1 Tax=Darwinula stevensoni TaxID=69355 RepID=A0A7R9FRF4_9CRUS|nr:unnamed protein product [Darwinula stevensoni]CAG0901305.1 unnamed protein product [Darwinula stevensoni]